MIPHCRGCGNADLHEILDLGDIPLANRFLEKHQLEEEEPTYPLGLCLCLECRLVQLTYTVDPTILFEHYLYITPQSTTINYHLRWFVRTVSEKFALAPGDLILEMGSNTGLLLRVFQEAGCTTVGIEPAKNLVEIAEAEGIRTLPFYFNSETAQLLV